MFIEGYGTFLVGRRQLAGTFIAECGTFVGGIKKKGPRSVSCRGP